MQHDSSTGVCVCAYHAQVCHNAIVACLYVFVSQPSWAAVSRIWAGHIWQSQSESGYSCVCMSVYVCVCRGWGCCHFGNATAHIAAITTAEKCFSATCNYYRLQIAVLASEALARKGETLCVCVCMWICVCVVTHKQTDRHRDKERWEMIIARTKNHNSKKMGELTYLWDSFRFKSCTDFQG